MESQSAAHELALTKLQNQEAALKDSLAKMAALSEGLAKDKVELNRILLQVSSVDFVHEYCDWIYLSKTFLLTNSKQWQDSANVIKHSLWLYQHAKLSKALIFLIAPKDNPARFSLGVRYVKSVFNIPQSAWKSILTTPISYHKYSTCLEFTIWYPVVRREPRGSRVVLHVSEGFSA